MMVMLVHVMIYVIIDLVLDDHVVSQMYDNLVVILILLELFYVIDLAEILHNFVNIDVADDFVILVLMEEVMHKYVEVRHVVLQMIIVERQERVQDVIYRIFVIEIIVLNV
jgi:hypothetical protein